MSTQELTKMMTEIRHLREETLAALSEMEETEFGIATQMERWTEIRRVLLRFGDHMREHANQINGARAAIKREPTMPQRILAESEIAWGLLLAAMVGLSDGDLDQKPPESSWSIRETLEHIANTERRYLQAIQDARLRE
jgi:hypothetical protein